jgi:hypothetical protein
MRMEDICCTTFKTCTGVLGWRDYPDSFASLRVLYLKQVTASQDLIGRKYPSSYDNERHSQEYLTWL